jgi:beta-lactamase regulating signal transducer with metallopeptidase domain
MSGALLDHLWQSTLFGLAIWSISLLLRKNSAAVRHGLWMLASLKFLVPFSVLHALGATAAAVPDIELAGRQSSNYLAALAGVEPAMSAGVLLGSVHEAPAVIAPFLIGAWILGSLFLAVRWFLGWRIANQLSAGARPSADSVVAVHFVDADIEPSVARVIRPVVLLPAALPAKLSASQLDAVLEHEREHIARHDNLKAHLHRLVETLFWFHPLVWFIGRRLVEERELACDEAVLARGHDAGEYAAGILAVCRHCTSHSPHAIAAVSGDLSARVRHILRSQMPLSLGFTKAFALTASALLLAAVPLIAGALDGTAHRRELIAGNARLLLDAKVALREAAGGNAPMSVEVTGEQVSVHNSSLRELIALAYGVERQHVKGRGLWLDSPRYDIHAKLSEPVREPEDFDTAALRAMVNKLLAARFDLEVHVNQQCQQPCGSRALAASITTP